MPDHDTAGVGTAHMRSAGRELLSLALIDARNQTLRWMAACEAALGDGVATARSDGFDPPLWTFGHIGWFQEHWIARNVQRGRGEACDPSHPKLASILPEADRWYDPSIVEPAARGALALPDLASTRQYLVDTLETTLDLLAAVADDGDDVLYFERLALFHEDLQAERFARLAQSAGFDPKLLPRIASAPVREPLTMPATRWTMGSPPAGFAFDNERAAHAVSIPEFEIDAQPVTWAQFVEFVEDGGYDEPAHWGREGWEWVLRDARRTPRHVDQMRQAVLQQRFGALVRVPLGQPAMHVTWHEADAWCRWAGRRLPAEVEWEAAAHQAASRGFRWGEAWEWTASTFRPYPGFVPGPWRTYSEPAFGTHRALRGASFATAGRLRHPKMRAFLVPGCGDAFTGFRSCAA